MYTCQVGYYSYAKGMLQIGIIGTIDLKYLQTSML